MSFFELYNQNKSYKDLKSALEALNPIIAKIKPDQKYFENMMDIFNKSIIEVSEKSLVLSKSGLKTDDFPGLNHKVKEYMEEQKIIGDKMENVAKDFQQEKKQKLKQFSDNYYKIIDRMMEKFTIFLDDIKKEEKKFVENEEYKEFKKSYLEKKRLYEKIVSNRSFTFETLKNARENFEIEEINKDKMTEKMKNSMKKMIERFIEENKELFDNVENIFKERFRINLEVIKEYFSNLHTTQEKMINNLKYLLRKMKKKYEYEKDVDAFCLSFHKNTDSKAMYMHQILMPVPIDDTMKKINASVKKVFTGVFEFIAKMDELQEEFSQGKNHEITPPTKDLSSVNEKIFNLITAMRETLKYSTKKFEKEKNNFENIVNKSKIFLKKAKDVQEENKEKFESEKEIPKNETFDMKNMPAISNFPGFDENFFNALGTRSDSFSAKEVKVTNSKKETDKIFDLLLNDLETVKVSRKYFLRFLEKFFNHIPVWTYNILLTFVERFIFILEESKNMTLAVKMSVEGANLFDFMPSICAKSYKNMLEEIERKKASANDEHKEKGEAGDDLLQRFIGEEEANKYKSNDPNKINFLTYVIEHTKPFTAKIEMKKNGSLKKATITVFNDKTGEIEGEDIKKKKINFAPFKRIRIRKTKEGRVYVMFSDDLETNLEIFFSETSEYKRFENMISSFYMKHFAKKNNFGSELKVTVVDKSSKKKSETECRLLFKDYPFFGLNKTRLSSANLWINKNLLKKEMKLKDSISPYGKTTKKIVFDSYSKRDFSFSKMTKMCQRTKSLKIWVGVFDQKNIKSKFNYFDRWVNLEKELFVFCFFNVKIPFEQLIKESYNYFVRSKNDVVRLFTKNEKGLFMLAFLKKDLKQYVHSAKTFSGEFHLSANFFYKDNNVHLILSKSESADKFKENDYKNIVSEKDEKDSSSWKKIFLSDNVIWVSLFEKCENKRKSINNIENLKLWDNDQITMDVNEKKTLRGFSMAPLNDFEPTGDKKNLFPTRVFYANNCLPNNMTFESGDFFQRNLGETRLKYSSHAFKLNPRKQPLSFSIEKTENNIERNISGEVSDLSVKLEKEQKEGSKMYCVAMCLFSDEVDLSPGSMDYNVEEKKYLWNNGNSQRICKLKFYVDLKDYILDTCVFLQFRDGSAKTKGYARLKINKDCFKQDGFLYSDDIQNKGAVVGSFEARLAVEGFAKNQ